MTAMKTTELIKRELPLLLILIAPLVLLLAVWTQLPDEVPTHWNLEGEVNGYSTKYTLGLLSIGMYLLMLVLPKIDPRKKNYESFSSSYFKIRLITTLFISVLSVMILLKALGMEIPMEKVVAIMVSCLIVFLGNYFTTLKPNWFIGIRVPWTLESETVWRKTHFLAGKLFFWTGLALLIPSFWLEPSLLFPILITGIAAVTVIPIVYSYRLFQQEKKSQS